MSFDTSKPFGECAGTGAAAFFQDGKYYNYHHAEVDESGFCIRCSDGECLGCASDCTGCDNEECDTCNNGCEGCNDVKCNFCDNILESGLKSVDYADLTWDELRAASRAAGGPATNKKACIDFLNNI